MVAHVVRGWIEYSVEHQLGKSIFNEIILNSNGVFNNKLSFMKQVLLDLGRNKNCAEYMKFLQNREVYLREMVVKQAKDVILTKRNNKTDLRIIIETGINKYTEIAIDCIERLQANTYLNVDVYLQMLRGNSQHRLLCSPFNSDYLRNLPINDWKRFSKLLIRIIRDSVHRLTEYFFASTYQKIETFPNHNNPIDLLSEKVLGCLRTCPFCSAQCCLTKQNHPGDHIAYEHFPVGFQRSHSADKNIHLHNCQVAVATNNTYVYCHEPEAKGRYRDYKTYYPNWQIKPDRTVKISSYWKWFMAQFENDFTYCYGFQHPPIPGTWKTITWKEAADSLAAGYILK